MKANAMIHIKRVIPALLIILMFSLFICFPVSAWQENKAVEGKTDSYIEKIEPRFFTEEPETALIQCYDVNEDGLVAVCMVSGYCKNSALVYDSDGHFLYGYEINDSGLTVVHWRDSDLQLCVISDNMLVTADGKGNIKSVSAVTDDQTELYGSYSEITSITLNGRSYNISKNPLNADTVTLTENGSTRTIYEAQYKIPIPRPLSFIMLLVLCWNVLLVIPVSIIAIVSGRRKKKQKAVQAGNKTDK